MIGVNRVCGRYSSAVVFFVLVFLERFCLMYQHSDSFFPVGILFLYRIVAGKGTNVLAFQLDYLYSLSTAMVYGRKILLFYCHKYSFKMSFLHTILFLFRVFRIWKETICSFPHSHFLFFCVRIVNGRAIVAKS